MTSNSDNATLATPLENGPVQGTAALVASDCGADAARARRIERAGHRLASLSYLFLFVLLLIFFYVLPEIPTLTHLNDAPRGSLDVPVADGTALPDVATALWRHLAEIIHPLSNPLIRFFLVTSLAGLILDQLIRARQRHKECE